MPNIIQLGKLSWDLKLMYLIPNPKLINPMPYCPHDSLMKLREKRNLLFDSEPFSYLKADLMLSLGFNFSFWFNFLICFQLLFIWLILKLDYPIQLLDPRADLWSIHWDQTIMTISQKVHLNLKILLIFPHISYLYMIIQNSLMQQKQL